MSFEARWQFEVQCLPLKRGGVWWNVDIYRTRHFWFRKHVAFKNDTTLTMEAAREAVNKFIYATTGVRAEKYLSC